MRNSPVSGQKRNVAAAVLGAVGMMVVATASASGADAREPRQSDVRATAFDGRWSILIATERGRCDRNTRVGLDIVKGVVTYESNPYGRVSPKGHVHVRLALGEQSANGSGRLARTSGNGVWWGIGSSGACSGRWFAERRD